MKRILAIGAAAAALMAVSSVASAQEDCINGWHMIKDNIPVRCDVLPSAFGAPAGEEPLPGEELLPAEEPMFTGSIDTGPAPVSESEQPPRPGGPGYVGMAFVGSADECQPGYFYMMELNSGNRPVACE